MAKPTEYLLASVRARIGEDVSYVLYFKNHLMHIYAWNKDNTHHAGGTAWLKDYGVNA